MARMRNRLALCCSLDARTVAAQRRCAMKSPMWWPGPTNSARSSSRRRPVSTGTLAPGAVIVAVRILGTGEIAVMTRTPNKTVACVHDGTAVVHQAAIPLDTSSSAFCEARCDCPTTDRVSRDAAAAMGLRVHRLAVRAEVQEPMTRLFAIVSYLTIRRGGAIWLAGLAWVAAPYEVHAQPSEDRAVIPVVIESAGGRL